MNRSKSPLPGMSSRLRPRIFLPACMLILCGLFSVSAADTEREELFSSALSIPSGRAESTERRFQEPAGLIGLTPSEAFVLIGAPMELFSFRGREAWQDDVVFYYENHTYLFWYDNRVWQVRFDGRFSGEVCGIRIGLAADDAERILGEPMKEIEGSSVFSLPSDGFPLRIRLFYTEGRISDIYVYRSDF